MGRLDLARGNHRRRTSRKLSALLPFPSTSSITESDENTPKFFGLPKKGPGRRPDRPDWARPMGPTPLHARAPGDTLEWPIGRTGRDRRGSPSLAPVATP